MKKNKKILFLFLIILLAIIAVFIYTTVSQGGQDNQKEKSFSEVEFLDTKLITLLNQMNNIKIRNYDVTVTEITKQPSDEEKTNSSSQSSGGSSENGSNGSSQDNGGSDGTGNSGGNSSSSGGSGTSNSSSNSSSEQSKEFELKSAGVLTRSDQIDWEQVKTEIEILYSSIPTITLDLYQLQVSQDDILNFNKEMDNLTLAVQEQNKENTLKELSILYDYMPKFMEKVTDNELKKTAVETKANLFKAYSKLDGQNWNEISQDVKNTIDTFTKLLTNTNIDSSKQYIINKVYVMLNELQNAVNVQDTDVFLIKYKNILEDINNL